ncbi:hypothetical protein [Haloterrigena alkaliphila]|uniref:Uncharacterized protein n=1 Tax=Haloterrigena alkaliphila TaxID=2816475 RepID=A0A8A2VGF8_9EURY|nr:hypothetical protein [Haloterrigena alkaliphila]QSX00417.1 hypothetical protein J0X25_05465 [Haloterrigena alkaliphila]
MLAAFFAPTGGGFSGPDREPEPAPAPGIATDGARDEAAESTREGDGRQW